MREIVYECVSEGEGERRRDRQKTGVKGMCVCVRRRENVKKLEKQKIIFSAITTTGHRHVNYIYKQSLIFLLLTKNFHLVILCKYGRFHHS